MAHKISHYWKEVVESGFHSKILSKSAEGGSNANLTKEEECYLKLFAHQCRNNKLSAETDVFCHIGLDSRVSESFRIATIQIVRAFLATCAIKPVLEKPSTDIQFLNSVNNGCDLTNTEALTLCLIRTWVFAMTRQENTVEKLDQLLAIHQISIDTAHSFNQYMHAVNSSITRSMLVPCPCSPEVSADEARLIGTLSAAQFNLEFMLFQHATSYATSKSIRTIENAALGYLDCLNAHERWLPLRRWNMKSLAESDKVYQRQTPSRTHNAPSTEHHTIARFLTVLIFFRNNCSILKLVV